MYVTYPSAPPAYVPPPRRSGLGLRIVLGVLVVLALCLGSGDAVLGVISVGPRTTTSFVGGDSALSDLLDRRAAAVTHHDEKAFLADVVTDDPRFVDKQRTEYENLQALGLSSFTLTLTAPDQYPTPADSPLLSRYTQVRQVGVTVKFQVSGIDPAPDAEPWIPTFVYAAGHWLLAGEDSTGAVRGEPFGTGGQPWEARAITVVRAAHVVVVISKEDAEIAPHLVDLAERGVTNVLKVYKGGWDGKVLVTAVSDQNVFNSYFTSSPDKLSQIEAVTMPRFGEVPEWTGGSPKVVLSRVVFNPATLGRGDQELQHTLTHELTHAALGLETSDATPRWLVEGMAEYVAYATDPVSDTVAAGYARRVTATDLPTDETFYDSADNYVLGWLAVKLIAQKYGVDKAFALYHYFSLDSDVDAGFQSVLGTTEVAFVQAWLGYLDKLRSS